jgi:Rieske Fe-S protein
MKRRDFVKQSCLACIGTASLSSMLGSCATTRYSNGTMEGNGMSVSKSEFEYVKKQQTLSRQFIIVSNDSLEFPIYVFRNTDNSYSALWMKCSHQGSELQASGDHLYCPSHGSEFNKNGTVTHGPAEKNLRTFPVTEKGDNLFIDLS